MKKLFKKLLSGIFGKILHCYENEKTNLIISQLGKCGKNVNISFGCSLNPPQNCFIGDNVFFGRGGSILTTDSTVHIGNKVMFGPEFMIITGDHRINVVGKYMFDIKEKEENNDLPVVIEDDVWIGARVIILKGVTIGEGSVVAAGSIVTKSVKPYSIVAGVPAKFLCERFSEEVLIEHKKIVKLSGDNI